MLWNVCFPVAAIGAGWRPVYRFPQVNIVAAPPPPSEKNVVGGQLIQAASVVGFVDRVVGRRRRRTTTTTPLSTISPAARTLSAKSSPTCRSRQSLWCPAAGWSFRDGERVGWRGRCRLCWWHFRPARIWPGVQELGRCCFRRRRCCCLCRCLSLPRCCVAGDADAALVEDVDDEDYVVVDYVVVDD